MKKTTSYEELSPECREQVDATVWLIRENIFPRLDAWQEDYLREHISNLVQSCLYIEQGQQKKSEDQA